MNQIATAGSQESPGGARARTALRAISIAIAVQALVLLISAPIADARTLPLKTAAIETTKHVAALCAQDARDPQGAICARGYSFESCRRTSAQTFICSYLIYTDRNMTCRGQLSIYGSGSYVKTGYIKGQSVQA